MPNVATTPVSPAEINEMGDSTTGIIKIYYILAFVKGTLGTHNLPHKKCIKRNKSPKNKRNTQQRDLLPPRLSYNRTLHSLSTSSQDKVWGPKRDYLGVDSPRVEFGGLSGWVDEGSWRVGEMRSVEGFIAAETGLGAWDCAAVG
jgi:hypothetical protein